MDKINLNNYEAYLLDFMEGNLSKEDSLELESFLNAHPEIDAEIFDISETGIAPDESIKFDNKLSLHRNEEIPEIKQRDALLIGLVEGDLSDKNKAKAEELINNDTTAARDFELYLKTRLKADDSKTLKDKNSLKKKAAVISLRTVRNLSAAAVLTGLVAFGMLKLNTSIDQTKTIQKGNIAEAGISIPISRSGKKLSANPVMKSEQPGSQNKSFTEQAHEVFIDIEKIKPLPRKSADLLIASNEEVSISETRNVEKLKPATPYNNLTFIINEEDDNSFKIPSRNEVNETLEEYNPIKKLREARNDLIASNTNKLFKSDK